MIWDTGHHTQPACISFSYFLEKNGGLYDLAVTPCAGDWQASRAHSVLCTGPFYTNLDKHARLQSHCAHKHTRSQTSTYQNTKVCALHWSLQSMSPNMLLTNLLVTVLQSTEIKWGDQKQLAVRLKWGKAVQRRNMLRSSRACNLDQSSRKWTKSLFH